MGEPLTDEEIAELRLLKDKQPGEVRRFAVYDAAIRQLPRLLDEVERSRALLRDIARDSELRLPTWIADRLYNFLDDLTPPSRRAPGS